MVVVWCNWLEGVTSRILMGSAANEKVMRKHLSGNAVYHTVAAEVVSTIISTTLYLDRVLSDPLPLMGLRLSSNTK